jgi:hypothetical protein
VTRTARTIDFRRRLVGSRGDRAFRRVRQARGGLAASVTARSQASGGLGGTVTETVPVNPSVRIP